MLLHSAHSIKNCPTKNIVQINVFNTDLTFSNLVTAAVEKNLPCQKSFLKERDPVKLLMKTSLTIIQVPCNILWERVMKGVEGQAGAGGGGVTKDGY